LRVFSQGGHHAGAGGRDTRDVPVSMHHGRRYLEAPRGNALLRVAVGLLSPEGYFAPIAHSSLVRVPPQQPRGDAAVEWLHVLPARGDGRQHERIVKAGTQPEHSERELPWRAGSGPSPWAGSEELHYPGPGPGPGSGSSSGGPSSFDLSR